MNDGDIKKLLVISEQILDEIGAVSDKVDADDKPTYGEKLADKVVSFIGSWKFIIGQSFMLAIWVALNVIGYIQHWDPYPFILLNLGLSLQAAFASPLILMAQNRADKKEKKRAYDAYRTVERIEQMLVFVADKIKERNGGNKNEEEGPRAGIGQNKTSAKKD